MSHTTATRHPATPDFTTDKDQIIQFWGHEGPYTVKFLGLCPLSQRRMYDMPGFPFPAFDTYNLVAEEYGMKGPDFVISWMASQEGDQYRKALALAKKTWTADGDEQPAAAPAVALSPALEVISRSTITSTSVTLPAGELGKLYQEVKKYLEASGGKWSTKAGAFLFTRDPREQLAVALATGKVVSTKKETQAFFTPAPVVDTVLSYLPADLTGKFLLEPEAGEGALADAARARGAEVECVELDGHSFKVLLGKGYKAINRDFISLTPRPQLFDIVLMNPPFSRNGKPGEDMKHVIHALKFLKPGGTLLAIMSPSFTFATNKAAREFSELVSQLGGVVETFEAGAFKESGTNVRTVLVKLTK